MHGVKRADFDKFVPSDEELQKIQTYKLLMNQFDELYNSKEKDTQEWAEKIMECTKNILIRNPEYYTAWNERKRALKLSNVSFNLIKSELMINVLPIKSNPKSYSAWYHRRWFIENYCTELKEAVVKEELELLKQLLDLDCRNFHGWNYRIWLANWAELSVLDEFDFTTLKIYQNFSNYSAWQRRSHLFPKYLETFGGNVENFIRNEVEMCRNAAWTEPSDQSVWFYQRWLFLQLPQKRPDLRDLLLKLARDQVRSINELISEEGRSVNVTLAMNFVRFVMNEVLKEAEGEDYLNCLKEVDTLRTAHYKTFEDL